MVTKFAASSLKKTIEHAALRQHGKGEQQTGGELHQQSLRQHKAGEAGKDGRGEYGNERAGRGP
jgi:hypothetical protein